MMVQWALAWRIFEFEFLRKDGRKMEDENWEET
jgi:hypothetical protein